MSHWRPPAELGASHRRNHATRRAGSVDATTVADPAGVAHRRNQSADDGTNVVDDGAHRRNHNQAKRTPRDRPPPRLPYSLPSDPADETPDGQETEAVEGGASGRGFGGTAPARLDTCRGTTPARTATVQGVRVAPSDPHGPPEGYCAGWGRRGRTFRRALLRRPGDALYGRRCFEDYSGRPTRCPYRRERRSRCRAPAPWRHAYGRPQLRSWRSYIRGTADVIAAYGYGHVARRLMLCGTQSDVYTCESCGDPYGSVAVRAGCDVRACPWCARRRAAQESARVGGAAERVGGYVALQAPAHLARFEGKRAELAAELVQLEGACAELEALPGASKKLQRKREVARGRVERVEGEASAVRRTLAMTRAAVRGKWSWKLITISPQYSVGDAASYSVGGLRARLEDVKERWRRLWESGLDAGGLAGAYLRVELSMKGHLHAHVLYYGPHVVKRWAADVVGCFVDVRAVGRDGSFKRGIREAVKYTLKAPSPLRAWWVAGARNRVPHTRLAGAWVVASRGRRLAEPYGMMRQALAAHDACEPSTNPQPGPRACASCGSEHLSAPRCEATALVARALLTRWRFHASKGGELSWGKVFPARITIERV